MESETKIFLVAEYHPLLHLDVKVIVQTGGFFVYDIRYRNLLAQTNIRFLTPSYKSLQHFSLSL